MFKSICIVELHWSFIHSALNHYKNIVMYVKIIIQCYHITVVTVTASQLSPKYILKMENQLQCPNWKWETEYKQVRNRRGKRNRLWSAPVLVSVSVIGW